MPSDDSDYVTGLEPRRRLEDALDDLLGEAPQLSLVIVDIVGLKRVNERGGFVAGDAVLKAAADRLREATAGSTGIRGLYRLGGDELVAIYAGPAAASGADVAVRLLAAGEPRPRLRIGTTAAVPGDTRATLLDRLYATARRS